MPTADFFTRFGLFVDRGFFDAEERERLLGEVRKSPGATATVGYADGGYGVDETVRRTKQAEVSDETRTSVTSRFLDLRPRLETYFKLELQDCQEPQFLVYREGDFFLSHQDSRREADTEQSSRERRVAVVVFLNGETETPQPHTYGGGSLTFYGLLKDPRMKKYGVPLVGEPGLLIGFPTELVHGVEPILWGERYTIVTWFR